jgi:uncharacterized protein GlcG (DUF336 family)
MSLPLPNCWNSSKRSEFLPLWRQQSRCRAWLSALCLGLLVVLLPIPAWAATEESSPLLHELRLPLQLAMSTASTAVEACHSRGAAVSASVVDQHGQLLAYLHGDGSAPHTEELSRHKAYTAASLASLQGFHTTTELATAMRKASAPIGDLPLPSDSIDAITPVPGGVVLRWQNDLLGGLGISGARQSQLDEDCALAAESWLLDQLRP